MASKTASTDAKARTAIIAELDRLGGLTVQDDTLIFEGDKVILPASMDGKIAEAISYLKAYERQQTEEYSFSRTFPYRPWDGAAAFDRAMKRVFGSTGIGKATYTFFGKNPPEFRTVDVAHGVTAQVPWGAVAFPPLDATFYLDTDYGPQGVVFRIGVEAPRKHRARIEGFLGIVADELRQRSIYRGKAINGAEHPEFVDVSTVDPRTVVYSADVMTQLDANLWSLLDHTRVMRDLSIPLKRAVLVEGTYGTGKTLAGALTAQRAVRNGWTFVLCRPGVDDLMTTLSTAQLYAPAVVWFEDIDVVGSHGSASYLSRLLDALDGISSKSSEVIAGFTTNHVDRLQKGLLRPGRIDTVIHIGPLDDAGIRRLTEVTVPRQLLDSDIDWGRVATAFAGYVPAFAKEAIQRAIRYSIARNGGTPDVVATDDLVNAAQGLRAQLSIMDAAAEGSTPYTLDSAMRGIMEGVNGRTKLTSVGAPFMVDPAKEPLDDALANGRT